MIIIEKTSKEKYNIDPHGRVLEEKFICPVCSHNRSPKNQRKKVLSWNNQKNV